MSERPALRALRGFIFDMDGVIYRGQEVTPGAAEFIANLRRAAIPFIYLTNNSSTPPDKVAARLAAMGIPTSAGEILTSAAVTAAEVSQAVTGRRALVIGEEGIRLALSAVGFTPVEDHRQADVVVVGIDRQATYAKLREAALAIRRGAPFYATNTDRTLPTELGLVPGAGAIVGFLEIATDVQPTVFGKPSPDILPRAARPGRAGRPHRGHRRPARHRHPGRPTRGRAHYRGAHGRGHGRSIRRHAAPARLGLPQPGGGGCRVFRMNGWRAGRTGRG